MRLRFLAVLMVFPALVVAKEPDLLCAGRYALAQEMLDSAYGKYGTLYSGGNGVHSSDNVGATLDLYRLWSGRPDQKFRDTNSADGIRYWEDIETRATHLPELLAIARATEPSGYFGPSAVYRGTGRDWIEKAYRDVFPLASSTGLLEISDFERQTVAAFYDVISLPSPPGWWLDDTSALYSPQTRATIARWSEDDFLVDWLQGIASASDDPDDVISYVLPGPTISEMEIREKLLRHYLAIFQNTGNLAAAVAAVHFETPGAKPALPFREWEDAVINCAASDAVYAAYAVAVFEQRFQDWNDGSEWMDRLYRLPPVMRDVAIAREALRVFAGEFHLGDRMELYRRGDAWSRFDQLASITQNEALRSWLNVGQTYLSDSIEQVIAANADGPLDPRTLRGLSLLSSRDLYKFAKNFEGDNDVLFDIYRVAYLRAVALRDADLARIIGKEIIIRMPELSKRFSGFDEGAASSIELARFALSLPDTRPYLIKRDESYLFQRDVGIGLREQSLYTSDLPIEYRMGGILQRDVEAWMMLPSGWQRAYRGMRGYTLGSLERGIRRGLAEDFPNLSIVAYPPQGPGREGVPFGKLVAIPELLRFGPENGLVQILSEDVIRWAETAPTTWSIWRWSSYEEMADALAKIVALNKHRNVGEVDGVFPGKRAFDLLHQRFAFTVAARKTKYWHLCEHERCER
ncbi:hypothetical protein [Neogemmobacter tilapiae]|uniref:DUF4034 domain-containing protein n=1 Tax=Neogemmobacter tilapiae TaxID=875041 RepID=A0A918TDG5_9RHOB|nr:hypothetical protein [Gemmobacter tilapiae]GHC43520.1 hypothetical protein GCM10007315_00650 [Gemmobacter tilapiae]